jgi:Cupredoxin-like domain
MNNLIVSGLIVIMAAAFPAAARADGPVVELRFENHRFISQTITVPANRPFRIKVINVSKETIEFESFKLNREKVVGPAETIIVSLPALSPGSYDFYDDFHQDVPEGVIIAK